jgi:hypothetical protein
VGGPLAVEILGIAHVQGIKGPRQGILGPRDTDEMDMVGHQAIGPNIDSVTTRVLMEPFQVSYIIGWRFEYELFGMPALDEMMRVSGDGGSGETGHRAGILENQGT